MDNSKNKRGWRINIAIGYLFKEYLVHRMPIIETLKYVAYLHGIEFSISINYQFENGSEKSNGDLICLRSTSNTMISSREFRQLFDLLLASRSLNFSGVEIGTQYQKLVEKMPFPKKSYRFLNYPWTEILNDGKRVAVVPYSEIQEELKLDEDTLLKLHRDLYPPPTGH